MGVLPTVVVAAALGVYSPSFELEANGQTYRLTRIWWAIGNDWDAGVQVHAALWWVQVREGPGPGHGWRYLGMVETVAYAGYPGDYWEYEDRYAYWQPAEPETDPARWTCWPIHRLPHGQRRRGPEIRGLDAALGRLVRPPSHAQ